MDISCIDPPLLTRRALGPRLQTVSHVVVRRHALMVYLVGHESPVYPEALHLAPTAFRLTRTPDSDGL